MRDNSDSPNLWNQFFSIQQHISRSQIAMNNALCVQMTDARCCSSSDRQLPRGRQISWFLSVQCVDQRSFVAILDYNGEIAFLENSGAEKVDNIGVILHGAV